MYEIVISLIARQSFQLLDILSTQCHTEIFCLVTMVDVIQIRRHPDSIIMRDTINVVVAEATIVRCRTVVQRAAMISTRSPSRSIVISQPTELILKARLLGDGWFIRSEVLNKFVRCIEIWTDKRIKCHGGAYRYHKLVLLAKNASCPRSKFIVLDNFNRIT